MQPQYPTEQHPTPSTSDEIHLIELVWFVWDSKITIITSALMCLAAAFGYTLFTDKTYTSNTLLVPLSSFEVNRLEILSSITGIEISAEELMTVYRQNWLKPGVIENGLVSAGFISEGDFESKSDFEEAIAGLAASVELQKAATSTKELSANPDAATHWRITFVTSRPDAWMKALKLIDKKATSDSREVYVNLFENWVENETIRRAFQFKDIQTQKANVRRDFDKEIEAYELKREFQLQDTQIQIKNAISDYERKTADRLAFLHEQASIARVLGVGKNTIEAQTFPIQTGIVANVLTDTPFYLRGYEAIEKEIELIEGRENTRAFTEGLRDLEQTQRTLEQDKTVERVEKNKMYLGSLIELEKKQRRLEQDKTIERAQQLFNESQLAKAGEFEAAQMVKSTISNRNFKQSLLLSVAFMVGAFIGLFVAAIRLALRRRTMLETAEA